MSHDLRVERRQPSPSRRPPLEHLPLPPSIYDKAALALSEPSREEITYVKVDPPARPSIRAISTSSPVTLPHASQEATSSTDSNISLVAKQTALFESISKSTSQDQSPFGPAPRVRSSDDVDIRFFGPSRMVVEREKDRDKD